MLLTADSFPALIGGASRKMIAVPHKHSLITLTVFAILAASSVAIGEIELDTGSITVRFGVDKCWTVVSIERNGEWFCDNSSSAQGTVIREDGEWAGSHHGNETLIAAELIVDGNPVSLQDGSLYSASEFVFTRQTRLGESFYLHSRTELRAGSIIETVTLTRTDQETSVATAYGFLGSRSNRLTEYAAFNLFGQPVRTGRTIVDGGGMTLMDNVTAIAQYDPASGSGIVSTLTVGWERERQILIWDRPEDNKLYFRFPDLEDDMPKGASVHLTQEIRFFDAPVSSWLQAAGAAVTVKPLAGDLNLDYSVGLSDLNTVLRDWGKSATAITDPRSDANGDGTVDFRDLNAVLIDWSKSRIEMAPPCEDINVDGVVGLIDLNAVLIDWGKSGTDIADPRADTNDDGLVDLSDLNAVLIGWEVASAPGDLNWDGVVDVIDLNMVLIDWGKTAPNLTDQRSDTNGDGIVNISDLNMVLIGWGK